MLGTLPATVDTSPGLAPTPAETAAPPRAVLRYAIPMAETGFDPARIADGASRTITSQIFEAPLTYDCLAGPSRLVPQTASTLPEASDHARRFHFRIRPGIHFADDPAFKGRRRELTAADYVYSIKRHFDPRIQSPNLYLLEPLGILGMSELRQRALESGRPFDYDTELEGLRALDRYTFEIRLAQPAPRLPYVFADSAVMGAVAREAIEAYAGQTMEHPVGTGPFRLAEWRRSSRIVLERNPGFRDVVYAARPQADDLAGHDIVRRLAGRRLPLADRVEIDVVEEEQPRWLAFLNGQHDLILGLPSAMAEVATPGGALAPHLRKRGIRMQRAPAADSTLTYFAMEHPVVGGYTPDKVALRRAIALAYDARLEIDRVHHGQAIPAQAIIPPTLIGHDETLKTEMSEHSVAKAKALLDLYGYVDRDGDGWRDRPDGSPLLLEYASQPDQASRQVQELWRHAMAAIGVRIAFKVATWPEQLKASHAGRLMMWGLALGATAPDGQYFLDAMYGPSKGQVNLARFDHPQLNALIERLRILPDGAEREALMRQAQLFGVAYMPYKIVSHRVVTDLLHPRVFGYRRHPYLGACWSHVEVGPLRERPALP